LEANDVGEATSREMATEDDKVQRPKGVEDRTRVKQCRGISTGVYIKGSVEDVPVQFTVDTGASRTVISTKVFTRVAERKQIELRSSSSLVGASGLPIQEFGTGHFVVQLGTHARSIEAIVANIDDEVLLGIDVLAGGSQCADILLSQNKIILDGIEIPCFQVGRNTVARRTKLTSSKQIPGKAEALADGCAERNEMPNSVYLAVSQNVEGASANEGHKLNKYTVQDEECCCLKGPDEDLNGILQQVKGRRNEIREQNIQKHGKSKECEVEMTKTIERDSGEEAQKDTEHAELIVEAHKDINVNDEKMDELKLDYKSRWKEKSNDKKQIKTEKKMFKEIQQRQQIRKMKLKNNMRQTRERIFDDKDGIHVKEEIDTLKKELNIERKSNPSLAAAPICVHSNTLELVSNDRLPFKTALAFGGSAHCLTMAKTMCG
jgi:hypothetical protein